MISADEARSTLNKLDLDYYLLDNRDRQTIRQYGRTRRGSWGVIPQGTIHSYEAPVTRSLIAAAEYIVRRSNHGSYHGLVGDDNGSDVLSLAPVQCETWHSAPTNNWSIGWSLVMYAHTWKTIPEQSRVNLVKSVAYGFYLSSLELIALGEHPIPPKFITRAQAMQGVWGFIFHRDTDPGRRTDPANPEEDFPKEEFLDEYNRLMAPVLKGEAPDVSPSPTNPAEEKSISQLADEVIDGKYGVGVDRKKALGALYNAVQAEVNRKLGAKTAPTPRKSIPQLADEVLAGKHGNAAERRRSLGSRYDEVQAEVNRKLGVRSSSSKSISQLATEVLQGKHGNAAARRRSLGSQYAAVQTEVNRRLGKGRSRAPVAKSISQLVDEVLRGKHGNGEARKKSLGSRYNAVQAEINRRL